MNRFRGSLLIGFLALPTAGWGSSGTEGASFLNIPVGARPAALGGAYSALAVDAYAPTWNPAGLGFLNSAQLAGQHLSYLESIHDEYLSFAIPLKSNNSALGASIQYLGSGDIASTDKFGAPAGTFSSHWGSYNLSYGRALTEKLSVGLTGKMIDAKIADVSAQAYAVDFGGLYRLQNHFSL